ncbi:MAG: porin [Rhizomicrobium sp.]
MKIRSILYAGAALAALTAPAFADDAAIEKRLDQMQKMIEAQQHQIETQNAEIKSLRGALRKKGLRVETATADTAPSTAEPVSTPEQIAAQNARIDELNRKFEEERAERRSAEAQSGDPTWSFKNGRPVIASADKRFSLAIRALGQFDAAYYMQSAKALALPGGQDFSSGTNFRRAQLGIQGTLFGDWSYMVNTEFGGSGGTESGGRVQALYVEYDGWKPLAVRVGAYPPAFGLEDNTGAADTMFLERTAPSDIIRNAVGGDGRDAASVLYAGENFYGALSYTGGKVGDSGVFDEQEAVVGRAAYNWAGSDSRFVISATGADMFRGPDWTPGPGSARALTLSAAPELTVDSQGTKLVSTGAVDTENARFWGVEGGMTWDRFYAQAGYFGYEMSQRVIAPTPAKPDLNFNGWYAQASWTLTGEGRGWSKANAAFTQPASDGGWGAWELAARYSDLDLNDHAGSIALATPFGGVRGGDQKIWTAGVNWYPNGVLHFALDYQWMDVSRLSGAGADIGQHIQALSFRSQVVL